MLESGESLRTWRLLSSPERGVIVQMEPLPHHRLLYLDYEGPVSGNRGTVHQWDQGTYSLLEGKEERLVLRMEGERCSGEAELLCDASGHWTFRISEIDIKGA